MTLHNAASWLVDRHVDAGLGERVAYVLPTGSVTYAGLLEEVWRAQQALRALDVRRGERVALVLDDDLPFPAWFLGCLRSGVIPVPMSTMLTGEELAGIVADAEAAVLVASGRYADRVSGIASAVPELRDVVVTDGDPGSARRWEDFDDRGEAPVAPTREDSPAFWLYTSGTTGTPKGAMHRHASLRATAETYADAVLGIGPSDRCLSVAKLFFAFGLGNSLTFPLSVGAAAVLNPDRPTPASVASLVASCRPTLFFASPGFVAGLLDTAPPKETFASVRATVTAGEALPAQLQQRFQSSFGHPVLDGIGTTEALHIFVSNRAGAERPGSSGTPVPGYEIRLVNDAGHEVPDAGVPGYLEVRGPSLATGYWCRDAATRAAFRGEWLATGDVYSRSEDGYWTFLGRNNDMIKAGGIWVSPAEVEAVLIEHPDVLEAAVVGGRDDAGLETTVAFCVARSGHAVDPDAIEAHCRARMAAFKRPRRIIVVDELPKTATGKVQRFILRERLA
ncbi:MAG: benzoate-CoA ligase family protein [Acidimicrobiaceae bacterium]|nr:benzoate-CoA ligase family protein [Acidimicrobiaceae bacterium]